MLRQKMGVWCYVTFFAVLLIKEGHQHALSRAGSNRDALSNNDPADVEGEKWYKRVTSSFSEKKDSLGLKSILPSLSYISVAFA